MKNLLPLIAAALLVSGCSVYREATTSRPPTDVRWQAVATQVDRDRMRHWRRAWDAALPPARAANAVALSANPLLFDPDRALAGAALPAGEYRCRTFKLGPKSEGMRAFTAYEGFNCRVADEGEVKSLQKIDGSQRPMGLLYSDSDTRSIFIGTLVLGDETAPLRYGLDANRDMIGYVERIDEQRWRLVFPEPRFESLLDVIELVPA